MEEQDRDEFDVIVTFHGPPQRLGEIEGLSIHHDVGFGRLSREAILRLAASDEVVSIALEPKDMPMPSELPPGSGGGYG